MNSKYAKALSSRGKKKKSLRVKGPSGSILYRNAKAVPFQKMPGAPVVFSMRNVERITLLHPIIHQEKLLMGGFGALFTGKIKFKGVAGQRPCVIKVYTELENRPMSKQNFELIITRLKSAEVPHPKMGYFEYPLKGGKRACIVMEPFVQRGQFGTETKFLPNIELLSVLDFRNSVDRATFDQVMQVTEKLSKVGLGFKLTKLVDTGILRADIFNRVVMKNGTPKVFVQDLDNFVVSEKSVREIFRESAENIVKIIAQYNQHNALIARGMLDSKMSTL